MEEKRGTVPAAWGGAAGGMEKKKETKSHKLTLYNRRSGTITGVTDVISFDEQEVVLETELGMMLISGEELHVTGLSLDTGELSIEGMVDGIRYSEGKMRKSGESLWKRLLK